MTTKKYLTDYLTTLLNDKVISINKEIKKIQDDANSDTKSSMGDKYETGREMAQRQKDKQDITKSQILDQLKSLNKITNTDSPIVQFGSLIETDKQTFFLSISIGEIKTEKGNFFALSPATPLGKILINKTIQDEVTFNKQTWTILNVLNN